MPQLFTDNARALLAGNIAIDATTLAVEAAKADRFPVGNTANWSAPGSWFKATLIDVQGNREVIKVGGRAAGNGAFTNLLRGQDGTAARAWLAGAAVVHGPLAKDIELALSGIFPYIGTRDSGAPKHEMVKTNAGTGAVEAAAMWQLVGGKMAMWQSNGAGVGTAERFVFDQTNGTFTCADFSLTSDMRFKEAWKPLKAKATFLQQMADVQRGTYRLKGAGKKRLVGVSAQDLQQVNPAFVDESGGVLQVRYGQAALITAIELCAEVGMLRAEMADIRAELKALKARK
jgi:hypothetical protein